MDQSTSYLIIAIVTAIPLGFLSNLLYEKIRHPTARIELSTKSPTRALSRKLSGLIRKISFQSEPNSVDVITDGSFIDSAIFFLAVIDAARSAPPIDIKLKQHDWASVPFEIAKSQNSIGYVNRRSLADMSSEIKVWSNLCSFHGYGLIGRPDDFPQLPVDFVSALSMIEALTKKRQLKVITYGSDSIAVLKTPLTPIFSTEKVEIESLPVEHALERFLGGHGDLFLGGLPQRIKCKSLGLVEVITSQTNPLMFGIDSMVFKGDVPFDLLERIASSWSRICHKLPLDEEYAAELFERWYEMAPSLEVTPVFGLNEFVGATHQKSGVYLKLFSSRDEAAAEVIQVTEEILNEYREGRLTKKRLLDQLKALHKIYQDIN